MGGTILLLLVQILMLVTGQIVWKVGVNKIGTLSMSNIWLLATSVYFWLGLIIYGVATVLWLVILSRANLSTVYPLQSMAYVLGVVGGIIIFGDKVSYCGWIGLVLIIAGVILTSSGLR